MKEHVYNRITNKVLAQLEKGVIPWHQPWSNKKALQASEKRLGARFEMWPQNAISGHYYGGSNVWMCWMHMIDLKLDIGREPALFLTVKQANKADGKIRKGEKATFVAAYDRVPVKPIDGQTEEDVKGKTRSVAFAHTVFHISQCEGVTLPEHKQAEQPIGLENDSAWNVFLKATKATIKHGGTRAFYHLGGDYIQMPPAKSFETPTHYKAVACHELTHWSGHPKRCDRNMASMDPKGESFAFEELVAELGAAFLCARLGLSLTELKHAEYLGMWLKGLKNDRAFIIQASSKAATAATYIMDLTKEALDAHTTENKVRKPKARQSARPKQPRQSNRDDSVERPKLNRGSVASNQRPGQRRRKGASGQART